ncbi:MAG: hypothetical protein NC308_00825 [Clostridium sp.]|nr:hypothetical protein [Bacteroides sp.]MCM1197407.1 hypothetical protein [Clostridium sp.]
MKNTFKFLFFTFVLIIFYSCSHIEEKIGLTARCTVEYSDQDGDGLNDSAGVTLSITLNEGSTYNYFDTVVLWDDGIVMNGGGLPVSYTQYVDLSTNAKHQFSFTCKSERNGSQHISKHTIPVHIENGEVSADLVVVTNGGYKITY